MSIPPEVLAPRYVCERLRNAIAEIRKARVMNTDDKWLHAELGAVLVKLGAHLRRAERVLEHAGSTAQDDIFGSGN